VREGFEPSGGNGVARPPIFRRQLPMNCISVSLVLICVGVCGRGSENVADFLSLLRNRRRTYESSFLAYSNIASSSRNAVNSSSDWTMWRLPSPSTR
jgi:hypothetical protein